MKILVCITHVPDTTSKITFVNDNKEFDKTGVQYIIGPYDDYALARAMEFKEANTAHVTVLNVGSPETEPTIRKALAIGADDAVRINIDPKDSFFTAFQIAEYAKGKDFDLILMGRESIDFNGGIVHGMVGALLNMPSFSPVMTMTLEGSTVKMSREIEGGKEFVESSMPLVAGCQEPIAEWRIPNMRGIMTARSKPLEVIEPVSMDSVDSIASYELPPAKSGVKLIDAENISELVQLLKNEAKVI